MAVVLLLPALAEAASPYQPQRGDPILESWRWTHFTELDGKGFRCMTETKDGSMWFGVEHGVIRYDGLQWTTYNDTNGLFDAHVQALCTTRDGTLWAGSAKDLSYFKDGTWTSVLSNAPRISITTIIEAIDGSIWIATGAMIAQFNRQEITIYARAEDFDKLRSIFPTARFCALPGKVAQAFFADSMLADASGRIWLASSHGNVACWDPKIGPAEDPNAWTVTDQSHGARIVWTATMKETRDGQILVGTGQTDNGLCGYDPTSGQWSVVLPKLNLSTNITETRDRTLWIGAHSRIMARRGDTWQTYEAAKLGLSPNQITLFESSDGALWLGTRGAKVFRIDYSDRRWSSLEGLNFMTEGPDGASWFLSVEGAVIRHLGSEWTQYAVSDGLISDPLLILCTKDGRTWVTGSHEGTAATAYLENGKWHRQLHPEMGWTIDYRSVLEGSDGRLWFGANGEPMPGKLKPMCCLASFQPSSTATDPWVYLQRPQTPEDVIGIAQTPDGLLYFGGPTLREQTQTSWRKVTEQNDLAKGWLDAVKVSPAGDLWVARGGIGVFRRHEGIWTKYGAASNLVDLMASILLCARDGTVWVATPKGISRFDGRSWTPNAFASEAIALDRESGTLRQSNDGRIWINNATRPWYFRMKTGSRFTPATLPAFRTISYLAEQAPPDTRLKVTFKEVSQPGNTLIAWEGTDPWGMTPANQLEFSYRFDGGEWSDYRGETEKMFLALKGGEHTFEVRARDMDHNVDPTPAQFHFLVIQPVWRQPWFLGLVSAFLVTLGFMEYRVLRRNYRLRIEVEERKQAQIKVEQQKKELENQKDQLVSEIDQRKQAEIELNEVHQQLLTVSRRAGMAEVATGILHNVGNVLNSVNISVSLVVDKVRRSKSASVAKVAALLNERRADLGVFITQDEKGKKLPDYLNLLAAGLSAEQQEIQQELTSLSSNIDHIKEIVAMQQEHARVSGMMETVSVRELIEEAIKMHSTSYLRHEVRLECEFGDVPPISTDKHKVLQILINLLHNAKYACGESHRTDKQVTVRTTKSGDDRVKIEVADNGMGIAEENLTKIFNHGFTTKKEGHGFGLHSGANAAKSLGGSLTAFSEGLGKGASFVLELPLNRAPIEST